MKKNLRQALLHEENGQTKKNLSGLDLRKHKRDIDDCALLGSLSTHLLSAPIYDQLL